MLEEIERSLKWLGNFKKFYVHNSRQFVMHNRSKVNHYVCTSTIVVVCISIYNVSVTLGT